MKHFKRILSILLTALLALGVLLPANAALPNDLYIETIGSATGLFEVLRTTTWDPLPVPFWASLEDDALAYCLESDRDQPKGDDYSVSQAFYNTKTLTGVQAILLHGAPNDMGGLTTVQACYATQVAIWCWMYESAGVGFYFYEPGRLRPASGNQAVYDFFLSLLNKARSGNTSVNHGISVTPSTVTLTANGGVLTGTATVRFTNLNGNYAIDPSKVPAGVTVQGSSYDDGDTITITAPMSYAGQTISMKNIIVARDTRSPANVFWYEPDQGDTQRLVVYDYSLQPVLWTDLNFTSEKRQGRIVIRKTNANPANGGYSLAGAVFEIFDENNVLVDTVTTNAEGLAQSKLLELGGYIVKEKTAPTGFLLNTGSFPVTLSAGSSNAEVIIGEVSVPEQPQQGRITITKANANPALGDYGLGGAVFEILDGDRKLIETVTTNAQGIAASGTLNLGQYIVRETAAPHGYVRNGTEYSVQLAYAGQTVQLAAASVDVPQQPQAGVIRLAKVNATPGRGDYSLAEAVFEIRDSNGTLVDTITTNSDGKANSKPLPLGSYAVAEKTAPYGFVRNRNSFNAQLTYAGQDVEIVYADVVVAQEPQVGTITVTKRDTATGSAAQGDATLAGAVFEVYASDKTTLVDTIFCGANDKATTKELPLGTYFVKERIPPVGYTLDGEFHQVKLEYAGQEAEVTSASYDLKNQVIQGQIAIVKHLDEPMDGYGDPQIQQPLEDAVFEIFLSAAGSYANAKETERDRLETNENGWALSKKLPYGVYTIAEVEAPGDLKLIAPFEVFISQEGKIYYFILENQQFRSQVKIIKVDAETGKPILLPGTAFKIKDLSTGDWVTQRVNYPAPMDISEFATAPDGTLVLPEPLKSGDYELVEVTAPRGYLLSGESVKFTVHSSLAEGEYVTVTMENKPVMGKLSVEKQGNMLVGAQEIETMFGPQYLPIFGLGYLAGAAFDVVTAEDIVTPDGTVRAKQGDVVDRIVTGADGRAASKELYLGDYELIETKAPENYVLDPTPHPVSLVYEDQDTAVVISPIGITNARQLVEIELTKRMEGFDKFGNFEDIIFGLFTAQDIFAEDGSLLVPKDSLILTQDSLVSLAALDADGRGRFEGELPFAKYYVMELQTAAGFILDQTKYPVDASYTGEDKAVTSIKVNGGEAIVNKRALGELRILKIDARTHEPLQGAKFGLYQGETLIGEAVSDKTGYALFKDLPYGEYQVKELEAPEGYILTEEIYTVFVSEHGQKILLVVLNQARPDEPDTPDEPDQPETPDVPDKPEVPDEPDQPEPGKPVPPGAPLPKTGDSKTIVVIALVVLILAGGAVLWLRKRGRNEDEPAEEAAEEPAE